MSKNAHAMYLDIQTYNKYIRTAEKHSYAFYTHAETHICITFSYIILTFAKASHDSHNVVIQFTIVHWIILNLRFTYFTNYRKVTIVLKECAQ